MPIPDSLIAEIKAANDILDVVGSYVPLTRQGNSQWFIGSCPFHQETDASFKVNVETQSWFCFGCGKGTKQNDGTGSDVFAFIREIEEVEFPRSCEILAERAGILFEVIQDDPATQLAKETMTEHNRRYATNLFDRTNQISIEAMKYLKGRGLTEDTILNFRLGLVPQDELTKRIDISNIAGKISIAIIEAKATSPLTLGMAYRKPSEQCEKPKYKNDTTSLCFTKGNNLYGMNFAMKNIRAAKFGIMVECYFGTMLLHQNGINNVVSPMGTFVTEEQLRLAKRFASTWIFMFDGDKAGREAAIRVLPMALKFGIKPMVVFLPEGDDADTFIMRIGVDKFKKWMIETKVELLDWYISNVLDNYDHQVFRLALEAEKKLQPILDTLPGLYGTKTISYVKKRLGN